MKLVITGAGGYIGTHVVNCAKNAGHEVIAVDFNTKFVPADVKTLNYNIFDYGSNNVYEELGSPDVLIHLAWRQGFVHNDNAHMDDLSLHNKFLRDYINGGGRNVNVMGSAHEIGYFEGKVTADAPCDPLSYYGVAKNALRQSMLIEAKNNSDLSLKWLRAYYIFGDDYTGSSIFAKITQAAQSGQSTFPFTTGKNKYDFINVNDLSEQIVQSAVQTTIDGVIEVCSGKSMSLAEKVEEYISENGYNITLEYGAFPDRPYDSPEIYGDNLKIREILEKVNLH